jgi:hypothetical protein
MFRRLPIMPLAFAATLGLFGLTSVLVAQPPKPPVPAEIKPGDDIQRNQAENAKLFKRFSDEALRLAQKWEKSENPEERERAKSLREALKLAAEKGVDNLFKELQQGLGGRNGDFGALLGKDAKLVAALEEILKALKEDESDKIAREIAELKKLIAEIERLKREQENIRARTEGKGDKDKIAKDQKDLANQTKATAEKFPGQQKNNPNAGQAGEPKDDKAEPKPEAKPGDASPEAKPETKENKSDDKPMGGMGDPKGGGEPKPMPMGGMPAGDDKPGMGDPKGGEPKPMGGDPKNPMDPKSGDQKPMAGDPKAQGDGKGEPKPSDGKPGGEGKPMSSQDMPMAGGDPSQSKPGSGMPMGGGQPSPGGAPPQPKDPAQQNVEEAVPQQKGAEEDIRKGDPNAAGKQQDEAIKKLEEALAKLEARLKQLREKELKQLLANLEERVGRMLRMQIEVKQATENIDAAIIKNKNQKTTADIQKSQSEADKELAIITEADKTLKLMEGEGSAVVFAGILSEVKNDMMAVQKRLNEGRVEKVTQDIEQDIIDQLTMMKEALKQAKQNLDQPPKPGQPSDGKPQDKKLIDLINELKLIKSQQEQVNKRTVGYNKQDPGEQAKDALVQSELKQLSDRQKFLQEMLHKIATEANQ